MSTIDDLTKAIKILEKAIAPAAKALASAEARKEKRRAEKEEFSDLAAIRKEQLAMQRQAKATMGKPFIPTRDAPLTVGERLKKTIGNVFSPLKFLSKIKASSLKLLKGVFQGFKQAFSIDTILGLINFQELLKVMGDVVAPINALLGIFVGQMRAELQPVIERLWEIFMDPRMIDMTGQLARLLIAFLVPGLELFMGIMNLLLDSGVIEGITTVLGFMADALIFLTNAIMDPAFWTGLGQMVVGFFVGLGVWIWDGLVAVGQFFLDFFVWLGTTIWDGLVAAGQFFLDFFIWLGETIWDGFKAVLNIFIGLINWIIDGLNALDVLDWFTDIPQIPLLQQQGVVRQTGVAVVDKGEAVVKTELLREVLTQAPAGVPAGGGRGVVNIIVQDPVVLDERNAVQLTGLITKQLILEGWVR